MTYGVSAALQKGVYETLAADASLTGLVGDAILDAGQSGPLPELFVSLGAEKVEDRSDQCSSGALHRCTISVISQDQGGFSKAKAAAVAVSDALDGAAPILDRGRIVFMNFERAEARRASGGRRRIDLRFAARVEDN